MKKVYYLLDATQTRVFGAITESHGQLPAFFTDETEASAFFASHIKDQSQHTFGGTDDVDSVRRFLNYNEKSYVLLDGEPMTGVEMFARLRNGADDSSQPGGVVGEP